MSHLFVQLSAQWKQLTGSAENPLEKAEALSQHQQWEQAIPYYEKAVGLQSKPDARTMLSLGDCLGHLERWEDAAQWYRQTLQYYPQNPTAHRALAKLEGDRGNLEPATHHYEKTLELQPDQQPWVYFSLARLWVKLENLDRAVDCYRQALQRKPQQELGLYLEFGRVLQQHGRLNEAIALYNDAIQCHPDWAGLYRALAAAQVQIGNQESAIHNYLQSFRLQFDQPAWAYANLESVLSLYIHTDSILEQWETIAATEASNPAVYYNLALLQGERGLLKPAIANCHQTLELAVTPVPMVYKTLGDILQADRQFEAAIAAYEQAQAQASAGNARLHTNWGTLYCKMQRWAEAEAQFQKAVDLAAGVGANEQLYYKLYHTQRQQQSEAAAVTQERWVARYYLQNPRHKLIFCPLHKNAVTLFKNIIVRQSDYAEEWEAYQGNIHHFLGRRADKFALQDFALTQDADYFKFAVLRNPFDRIVSAYFDKFAKYTNIDLTARPVVVEVHKCLGMEPDIRKSITFSQFVQYLVNTEDFLLDEHWRPQHTFLCRDRITFDFIGQFENLEATVQVLEQQFGFQVKTRVTSASKQGIGHITHYAAFEESHSFHEMYPAQLRELGAFPTPQQMYTPELRSLIQTRFKEDLELYSDLFGNVSI